ncbi:MAG: phosphatase PAP2 family protein [Bacteroidales bacterium]|nr:phosphatase PAP2 family protein [Bacteroidales bacterium]
MFKFLVHLIFIHLVFIHSFSQNTDIKLLKKINLNRNQKLDNTFRFVTNTRGFISSGVIAGMATYAWVKKDSTTFRKSLTVASSLLVTATITTILKYSVNRERPYITYPEIEKLSSGGSASFPSGHTSEAFSTATALSIEYPKWYIITPAIAWATAVGYSRMHLGVHYPSDVLARALIGSGSAFLCHWLNQKIQFKKKHVKTTD